MRMTFTYINTALALALASALAACGTAARTAGGPQAASTGPAATPPDSLRITVGTPVENDRTIETIKKYRL